VLSEQQHDGHHHQKAKQGFAKSFFTQAMANTSAHLKAQEHRDDG
jgi:hypothetical protein